MHCIFFTQRPFCVIPRKTRKKDARRKRAWAQENSTRKRRAKEYKYVVMSQFKGCLTPHDFSEGTLPRMKAQEESELQKTQLRNSIAKKRWFYRDCHAWVYVVLVTVPLCQDREIRS